jgi:hypothetical protein
MARQPSGPSPSQNLDFEITRRHHTREDASGRVIRPSQIRLPDNTQHSQEITMPPAGFEPVILKSEKTQTDALDCAATGIG